MHLRVCSCRHGRARVRKRLLPPSADLPTSTRHRLCPSLPNKSLLGPSQLAHSVRECSAGMSLWGSKGFSRVPVDALLPSSSCGAVKGRWTLSVHPAISACCELSRRQCCGCCAQRSTAVPRVQATYSYQSQTTRPSHVRGQRTSQAHIAEAQWHVICTLPPASCPRPFAKVSCGFTRSGRLFPCTLAVSREAVLSVEKRRCCCCSGHALMSSSWSDAVGGCVGRRLRLQQGALRSLIWLVALVGLSGWSTGLHKAVSWTGDGEGRSNLSSLDRR